MDSEIYNKSHLFVQFEVKKTSIDKNQFKNTHSYRLNLVRMADFDFLFGKYKEFNDFEVF